MSYREYYPILNKDPDETEAKETQQTEILKKADYIFANGPVLRDSAQDIVGSKSRVIEILPGISEVVPREEINNLFSVVTFGRIEQQNKLKKNNSIIKQTYLAVAAWANFVETYCHDKSNTLMKVYGKNVNEKNGDDGIEKLVHDYASSLLTLYSVKYEENHDLLMEKLASFSTCLVLSLREGYGLTAIEAVSAGVPLIVSKSSGFYKSLLERKIENYVHGVEIKGASEYPFYAKEDLQNVSNELYDIYHDQDKAKKEALKLKDMLISKGFTWETCANTIIQSVFSSVYVNEPTIEEKEVVGEILQSFNRPVFLTDFHEENSIIEVKDGLKDTISIINTGIETRQGKRISKYSIKDCSKQTKKEFGIITDAINLLSKIISEEENEGRIWTSGKCLIVRSTECRNLMNSLRNIILCGVASVALRIGIEFNDFSVPCYRNEDRDRLKLIKVEEVKNKMYECYSEYKTDIKYTGLFK